MKTIKSLWVLLLSLYLILFTSDNCKAQDCPNWGAAIVVNYNYSELATQFESNVELKGVVFNFTKTPLGDTHWKCDDGSGSQNITCKDYSIIITVTNNNSYKVSVSLGEIRLGAKNDLNNLVGVSGVIGLEDNGLIPPGGTVKSLNIQCTSCGYHAFNCWCGSPPIFAFFKAAVTDMRAGDFENWRSSAENYYAWARDKDTEPIEYRLCAKQHYLNALSYKEDKYCRDKIAEIDGFLKKINDENIAYNKKVDAYNQKIDEYNNLNKAINENINAGEYEKALELLGKLKTIASVISPEEALATESRINELKKFIAENSNKKVDNCPEGDKLINEYSTALNGYLTSLSKTLNGGSNSADNLIASSQKITDITQLFTNLGCTLTPEQTARFDELMAKFANAAMEISEKGLDNVLKEVEKPLPETTNKGNFMPLIGTASVDPMPKMEYRPSLSSNLEGAQMKVETQPVRTKK